MRCEACGAVGGDGDGYCRVCAAPLARGAVAPALLPSPPRSTRRSRALTIITLSALSLLLLLCVVISALSVGLSALIQWR